MDAMNAAERLKLQAIDEEDLAVLSAHVQDAILKVGDITYLPREHRFAIAMNRFGWEVDADDEGVHQRRRSALVFDRVTAAKCCNLRRDRPDAVLELLAVSFDPTVTPAGHVTLHFAGGGMLRLEVECIEARLADLGPAWATAVRPDHAATVDPVPPA
jgi:Protein of unknown function (DUF2948)